MKVKCSICGKITEDKGFNFFTNHRGCNFCNKPLREQIILTHIPDIKTQIPVLLERETNPLKFDFMKNTIIFECDGLQHFQPVKLFGGDETFKVQIERDYAKNQTVKDNYHGNRFIRIFSDEIINDKVDLIFNSSTTIEMLDKNFKNIFVIENGKVILQKGKYIGLTSCTLK
jgi:hypothetical protein